MMSLEREHTYWYSIWRQFKKRRLGYFSLIVILIFGFVGIYAPFFASSKPLMVNYDGQWFFPLFRYLFYTGFYTKRLDLFFNLMMFSLPLGLLAFYLTHGIVRAVLLLLIALGQIFAFLYFSFSTPKDPAVDPQKIQQYLEAKKTNPLPDWNFELKYMTPYEKLNKVLKNKLYEEQQYRLSIYSTTYANYAQSHGLGKEMPTLWQLQKDRGNQKYQSLEKTLQTAAPDSETYRYAKASLNYQLDRRLWLQQEQSKLRWRVMPLLSHFHWEEDAGGGMTLNQVVDWRNLTRINRKDLLSALIFGIRISLVVGLIAVAIALAIGVPIGALSGYFGGTFDIIVSRLLEIWESMPTFFMLLLVVAVTQSKSIFLVIAVIGIFSWPTFSRYIRGEFFKQRNLPYIEACRSLGFRNGFIMFSHILPNAIPPLLTLLPFAIMGAITSEAGLSFLGLGEEGSTSWGVLMDEGRTAFPGESYLLWPPAILLTILLIAIALVGDALRDSLDPKLH